MYIFVCMYMLRILGGEGVGTKFYRPVSGGRPFRVKWNWLGYQKKSRVIIFEISRNIIISLSIMVTKNANFDVW